MDVPCSKSVLKTSRAYHSAKEDNHKSSSSPSTCPYYKEFGQILATVLSTEPTVMHDWLLSSDGSLYPMQLQGKEKGILVTSSFITE